MRGRHRGYESSPNVSEFSDINEFLEAKIFSRGRHQARESRVQFKEDDDFPSEEAKDDTDTHSEELNEGASAQEGTQQDAQQRRGARRSLDTDMHEANGNTTEQEGMGKESSKDSSAGRETANDQETRRENNT